jgi:N-methylhydantoinase A
LLRRKKLMAEHSNRYRVGCDIGGTFTDFVLFDRDTGSVRIEKCLSTPRDPSDGVMQGLDMLGAHVPGYLKALQGFAHASTLVANAVIERKGARTALLCTNGFRDLLEVRRHVRVTTYELWSDPPEPLVPRFLRLPVTERVLSDGTVLKEVEERELREIAKTVTQEGVESLAIAFLHSYVNPINERRARDLLAKLLPGLPISISSQVLPKIKEYERTSTTVVNAYVRPIVEQYISRLRDRLRAAGVMAPMQIMMSNGGVGSPETAMSFPIRMIESGPVAGAKIAQYYRNLCRLEDVLAFDMGGTTAKGCLIRHGQIPITDELEVARSKRFVKSSGYPVSMPGAHLIEIGAGGGSIAKVGKLGVLEVGPESAGAEPGPVCYGRGGSAPTVTDADLVLGYLNESNFAGGSLQLDKQAARESIEEAIAAPLNRDVIAAAWSIHDVINETMAAAVRMHMTERGGQLDAVTLIGFGGAGPVHAYSVARKLKIKKILVPERAGVLSAVGLLVAPPAFDLVKTFRARLDRVDAEHIETEFRQLEQEIEETLRKVDPQGAVKFERWADLSYSGQGYHVSVPTTDLGSRVNAEALWTRFADLYRDKYGYFYEDVPGELVALRVNGQITGGTFHPEKVDGRIAPEAARPIAQRKAYSEVLHSVALFDVYDRASLTRAVDIPGPCLVEEPSSTTVVDFGGRLALDDYGSLLITLPSRDAETQTSPSSEAPFKEVKA